MKKASIDQEQLILIKKIVIDEKNTFLMKYTDKENFTLLLGEIKIFKILKKSNNIFSIYNFQNI